MPSSMLWSDMVDNSVSKNYPSLRRNSARRKSKLSRQDDQEEEKKGYLLEQTMLSSDVEELTEDEFGEQTEIKNFNYFKIFKIPLMLFILSFVSIVFVEAFGKDYVLNKEANGRGMFAMDPNYGSYIWNISGK